ncbi:hypothetical protein CBL_02387 [Carabus blaptoides fortunei]
MRPVSSTCTREPGESPNRIPDDFAYGTKVARETGWLLDEDVGECRVGVWRLSIGRQLPPPLRLGVTAALDAPVLNINLSDSILCRKSWGEIFPVEEGVANTSKALLLFPVITVLPGLLSEMNEAVEISV